MKATCRRPFWTCLALAGVQLCCGFPNLLGQSAELSRQRALWRAQNIQQYSIEFQAACLCPNPLTQWVVVDVLRDSIRAVTLVDTAEPVGPLHRNSWWTIDELFAVIESAIEQEADSLLVRYDSAFGYPTLIAIDYVREALDDEMTYRVRRLVVR